MLIEHSDTSRRVFLWLTALGGWGSVPFMMVLAFTGWSRRLSLTNDGTNFDAGGSGSAWLAATLVMAAVVGGMSVMATVDAARVLRDGRSTPGWDENFSHVFGVVLGVLMWFFGAIANVIMVIVERDCGEGVATPCLDHPGPVLNALFLMCMVAPTFLLLIGLWLGTHSRVFALLMPPLIAGMYLLGIHLHLPHVGFGDVTG